MSRLKSRILGAAFAHTTVVALRALSLPLGQRASTSSDLQSCGIPIMASQIRRNRSRARCALSCDLPASRLHPNSITALHAIAISMIAL